MKKYVWITTIWLVISSFSVEIAAQENIAALIKKCETIDAVDMNVLRKKDTKTNEVQPVTTSITVRSNPVLSNEFLEAFKKDKEKASETVEQKREGNVFLYYKFADTYYSFALQKKDNTEVMEVKTGINPASIRMRELKSELNTSSALLLQKRAELAKKRTELEQRRKESAKERTEITKLRKKQKEEVTKLRKEQEKERAKLREEMEKAKKK